MSRASTLFRLQEIDLELDALRARLRAIDESLGDYPALREIQRLVVEAETRLHAARVNLRTLEQDNQALNEKIAEVEQRLYSGAVTNTKELQDLQKDLDSLKRRREAAEEQQFDVLIAAEAAETQLADLQANLNHAETEAAKTNTDLVAEQENLTAKAAQLESQREAILASVPADDRETYDRLRRSKNGRALTRLADGVCTACGVAPSSARMQDARRGSELIRCGNCDRILYAD